MSMSPAVTGAYPSAIPPSPSASIDSDLNTDIDSVEASILDQHHDRTDLPPPGRQTPSPPPRQHPQRHSSLVLREQTHAARKIPRHSPSGSPAEEKYHFDEFWDHFHKRRKGRPNLLALETYHNSEYGLDSIMDGRRRSYNARAYEYNKGPSLVHFVRNGWKANNTHSGWSSPTDLAPSWAQILSAPRLRRWILIFLVSVSLSWLYWRRYGANAWMEHRTLHGAVSARIKSDLGYFGTNMLPEFVGMTQVKTLDTCFVPGVRDSRRLIFVGDVHGCHDECMLSVCLRSTHLSSLIKTESSDK